MQVIRFRKDGRFSHHFVQYIWTMSISKMHVLLTHGDGKRYNLINMFPTVNTPMSNLNPSKHHLSFSLSIPFANFVSVIQQNSSGSMTLNAFTPFGGGSRLCPGYELARVELSVFLHHLVTQFRYSSICLKHIV